MRRSRGLGDVYKRQVHAGFNPHPGHAKAGDEADDIEHQLPFILATHEDEFSVKPLIHG